MDDLFTIFIIIAAIISFLSKMFRKDKDSKSKRAPTPVAKPKSEELSKSWFEEILAEEEVGEPEEPKFEFERVPEKKVQPKPLKINEEGPKTSVPVIDIVTETKKETLISALNIKLKSADDLKRGIVLAEILGSCKANKKIHRFYY